MLTIMLSGFVCLFFAGSLNSYRVVLGIYRDLQMRKLQFRESEMLA